MSPMKISATASMVSCCSAVFLKVRNFLIFLLKTKLLTNLLFPCKYFQFRSIQ